MTSTQSRIYYKGFIITRHALDRWRRRVGPIKDLFEAIDRAMPLTTRQARKVVSSMATVDHVLYDVVTEAVFICVERSNENILIKTVYTHTAMPW